MNEVYKLYRKHADDADKLFYQVKERDIAIQSLEAEVARLKGVLEFIASTIGSFEGMGSYTAYVEMTGGLMDEANKALEAKP